MQERLFRLAYEALAITAYRTQSGRWHLHVVGRRGDESFAEAARNVYDELTTEEMVDVLEAELQRLLG